MPKTVKYTCDTCKEEIEWTAFIVTDTVIKAPSIVYDVYYEPQPQPTYCSMECLAKSLEFWLERYNRKND